MRTTLTSLERTEHGLLLHFPFCSDVEAELRRFAADEKRCCQFWGFEVLSGDDLTLRWDAPPSAGDLVDELEAFFRGDAPASALAGLL